jgi:hypothetical protein
MEYASNTLEGKSFKLAVTIVCASPLIAAVEISEKVYHRFVAKYTTWKETYKLVQI